MNVRTSAIFRTAGGHSFSYRTCSNTFETMTPRWNEQRIGRFTATSAAKASPQNPAFVPIRRRSVMYVPNPTSNTNRHFGYLTRCSHTIIIEPWSERIGEPSLEINHTRLYTCDITRTLYALSYITRQSPLNALLSDDKRYYIHFFSLRDTKYVSLNAHTVAGHASVRMISVSRFSPIYDRSHAVLFSLFLFHSLFRFLSLSLHLFPRSIARLCCTARRKASIAIAALLFSIVAGRKFDARCTMFRILLWPHRRIFFIRHCVVERDNREKTVQRVSLLINKCHAILRNSPCTTGVVTIEKDPNGRA